ncbi:MAG: DUF2378 family protein [Myxococcaceae bacterium]
MSTSTVPGKMVHGLFNRVLGPDLTPELKASLRELGVDLAAAPPDSVPRATWYQAIDLTAKSLYPTHELPIQQRKLGEHVIEALQSRGIVKGAWLTMAKFAGPRRALKQAMDFTDRSPVKLSITELSKTEFEISVDDREQPEFLAGLLESAIGMLGGKSPKVLLKGPQGDANLFRATWR